MPLEATGEHWLSLDLDLKEAIVNHPMWVLETELRYSGREAFALNH